MITSGMKAMGQTTPNINRVLYLYKLFLFIVLRLTFKSTCAPSHSPPPPSLQVLPMEVRGGFARGRSPVAGSVQVYKYARLRPLIARGDVESGSTSGGRKGEESPRRGRCRGLTWRSSCCSSSRGAGAARKRPTRGMVRGARRPAPPVRRAPRPRSRPCARSSCARKKREATMRFAEMGLSAADSAEAAAQLTAAGEKTCPRWGHISPRWAPFPPRAAPDSRSR